HIPSRATAQIILNLLSLPNRQRDLFVDRRSTKYQKRKAMLTSQEPISVMLLLRSPPARSYSWMNFRGDRRPIFYLSLKGFLEGQIRGMNRQRRRGMMIGGLQLVTTKPITMRLGKVQIVLIKIKVGLFVVGKSASDTFKSSEFGLIQFE